MSCVCLPGMRFRVKILLALAALVLVEGLVLPWPRIIQSLSNQSLTGERQVLVKLNGVYKLKRVEYVGLDNIYVEHEDSLVAIPQDSLYEKVYVIHHSTGLEKKPRY